MGLELDRDTFDAAEYARFSDRLRESLDALEVVLSREGFGEGPPTIGAELELNLVDAAGRAAPINRAVLAEARERRLTLEVDRFNLEINTDPVPLAGAAFGALGDQLEQVLAGTAGAAALHGARVALIGILPTLSEDELQSGSLTEGHRYRALSHGIRRLRRACFPIRIEGEDSLVVAGDDVTFEGANTSLQLHLRVLPRDFARAHDAAQIATAPALAAAVNSPFFLGRRLWHETRVALFRQSVDDRRDACEDDWRPARVSFGHGWVRRGAFELFAQSVRLHEPLLPVLAAERPLEVVASGGMPQLSELRLHQGTVWRWNRAIYDASAGGHLRIELRALPAGPTVRDMMANAAFLLGLMLGLMPDVERMTQGLLFGHARRNFYEAARHGLDSELLWPVESVPSPQLLPALALIPDLLRVAERGLVEHGVDAAEAASLLSIVRARLAARRTGASWQRDAVAGVARLDPELLRRLLERYLELSASGRPVHEWPAGLET